MSKQLDRYQQAREFGHGRADAAAYADISLIEAELIDTDHEKNTPAPGNQLRTSVPA